VLHPTTAGVAGAVAVAPTAEDGAVAAPAGDDTAADLAAAAAGSHGRCSNDE